MRRVWTLALAVLLALGMMAPAALADEHDPKIASPAADEVVYENTLQLSAAEDVDTVRTLRWRIRDIACDEDDQSASDNVAGEDVVFDGKFEDEIDISKLDAGQYCFVYNTLWDADGNEDSEGSRVLHDFYIVDEYAKVGGVLTTPDGQARGNGTHAMDGVVGNAGDAGTVGSIAVNYRELRESKTFEARSLELSAASGVGVEDDTKRAEITTEGDSKIIVLDRDADGTLEAPRGAIVLRFKGDPSDSEYEIDATPDQTGADSWVPMTHGNNHVGTR